MTQKNSAPLVLVDGSSYLYRAFHAMPNLGTSDGEPTGAIYGVINMLRRLLRDFDPTHMAVVFDARGKTFRDDIYPEYKANRPPMPDELARQIEPILEIIAAMGIPLLQVEGVEADDVIGTLARQATASGMRTVISTGDKDLAQLVDNHVTLMDTMKESTTDADGVVERFGVPAERVVDYLALVGDTSDNIPGVPGVGPKTAARWLTQYGSLDGVVANAAQIGGKAGENLRASLDQLELARRLATIRTDLDLARRPGDLSLGEADTAALRRLFSHYQFKTWLSELGGLTDAPAARAQANYEMIVDEGRLGEWIERLSRAELFAFDTETTDLDAINARLVGLSFADAGGAAYVPVAHAYLGAPAQLDTDLVLERLRPLLESDDHAKVGQNLKYDMNVLANHGVRLGGIRFDTMLESYVLDSTASRHDLDTLALKHLGHKNIAYEEVTGKGRDQIGFCEVPVEQATQYAAEDADVTFRLHQALWPRLAELPRQAELFHQIEMPLVPVLARVERNGVGIDAAMLAAQSRELEKRMAVLEEQAYELADTRFNMASPRQIQEILYDKLQLPVLQKTPKGQPSTAEAVLAELAVDFPLPRVILDHRSVSKLKSTYTDKLPQMINPRTGRVHTSYHQAVAATGRLSSSDPNLQNIPIRTAEGRRIRAAFVPRPGYRMLSADYSQIELRIMAHLSGDDHLLSAFAAGRDVHRATAAEVFGVALDQVSDDQRRTAKAINFGLMYGMSAFGLARQLHIDRAAAQEYVQVYFDRHPGVRKFMDDIREQARSQGYVETVYGRRLYLPEIRSPNQARRQYAERTAINAPMQGSAADLIKRAMIAVDRWIGHDGAPAMLIMQVHDELVLEVEAGAAEACMEQVRRCMVEAGELSVPLVVDAAVGDNWNEAHP